MKRSLIFFIAVVVALNFSCHSIAHPGHGYYIEEPSDTSDKTSDVSTSTSSGTSTSKSTTSTPSTNYHETQSTTSDSKSDATDNPETVSEYGNSSQDDQSLEQNNSTNRTQKTGNYGFIPAMAGLCLVFGLTAFRFPRK